MIEWLFCVWLVDPKGFTPLLIDYEDVNLTIKFIVRTWGCFPAHRSVMQTCNRVEI